ncbi:MAG TPA: hypothetical protein VFU47_05020, partial [Armatimonadota bacterium]|nr:hypothetical protein [Armatimonadota bacterium]
MRQVEACRDPIPLRLAPTQHPFPVERLAMALHGHRQIAQPQWPPGAMLQEVQREEAQVLLGAGDQHGRVAQLC